MLILLLFMLFLPAPSLTADPTSVIYWKRYSSDIAGMLFISTVGFSADDEFHTFNINTG